MILSPRARERLIGLPARRSAAVSVGGFSRRARLVSISASSRRRRALSPRLSHLFALLGRVWANLSASLVRLFLGRVCWAALRPWRSGSRWGSIVRVRANRRSAGGGDLPDPQKRDPAAGPAGLRAPAKLQKVVMVALGVFLSDDHATRLPAFSEIDRIYLDVGRNSRRRPVADLSHDCAARRGALDHAGMKLGAGLGLILIAIAR